MRLNVYSLAVFAGVDLFALKFYLDRVIPQLHRDTGLPDGEDRFPLRSLVSTQYRSVTDRRMDGFTVAYTALVKLALRSAVIKPALADTRCDGKPDRAGRQALDACCLTIFDLLNDLDL